MQNHVCNWVLAYNFHLFFSFCLFQSEVLFSSEGFGQFKNLLFKDSTKTLVPVPPQTDSYLYLGAEYMSTIRALKIGIIFTTYHKTHSKHVFVFFSFDSCWYSVFAAYHHPLQDQPYPLHSAPSDGVQWAILRHPSATCGASIVLWVMPVPLSARLPPQWTTA